MMTQLYCSRYATDEFVYQFTSVFIYKHLYSTICSYVSERKIIAVM